MHRLALVTGLVGLLLAALSPGVAAATIVPQVGMLGIRVGMTKQQVWSVLEEPSAVAGGTNDFGPYLEWRYPHRLTVVFQGGRRVTSISTRSATERTTGDVGVGSTEAEVKAGVPGVRCESVGRSRSCHVGTFRPGQRVTDFLLRGGRVVRVTIGIVVD